MANLSLLLTSTMLLAQVGTPANAPTMAPPAATRIIAEFETQAALVVALSLDEAEVRATQAEMICELLPTVKVVVLVQSGMEEVARSEMVGLGVPVDRVRLVSIDYDTLWIRDYGPLVRSTMSGPEMLDFRYCETRPHDEKVPQQLGCLTRVPLEDFDLEIDGGNFLTNGRGLVLATKSVYFDNDRHWRNADEAERGLAEALQVDKVLLLEQLIGEPTSHVDMFATFTDERTVIIGEYDKRIEPENAEILDRNATRLATIRTPSGPLRVLRIPMPPPLNDTWFTFANVVYANGTLLLPQYSRVSKEYDNRAVATYRHALPDWKIVRVDAQSLIERAGSLHCATLNLPRIDRVTWEPLLLPRRAVRANLESVPVASRPSRSSTVPTGPGGNWRTTTPLPEPVRRRD